MSGLFHRRTRSASAHQVRNRTPAPPQASTSAHLAATQAFMSHRASQPNLSQSAAAAALRALSPTPTPIDQIQTKRMLQRQNSTSSLGGRGRGRSGLNRSSSPGSMTERTFRTPSPARSPTPTSRNNAPPVPKFPDNFVKPPPIPAKSQRRPQNSETSPPPRVLSPPLARSPIRNQAPVTPTTQQQPRPAPLRQSSATKSHSLERTDSRNSINFSYPRPSSPPAQSPTVAHMPSNLHKTPRSPVSTADAQSIQYDVNSAADQPVKKKKKKVVKGATEGSHFQTGTMGGKPTATPLAPGPVPASEVSEAEEPSPAPAPAPAPVQQQPTKKKKKKVAIAEEEGHDSEDVSIPRINGSTPNHSDSESNSEQTKRALRASGALAKQPSVVKEDWEGEQRSRPSAMKRSQDREEQGMSPITSPETIVNGKRPTTAANMSRKMEDPGSPTRASVQPVLSPSTNSQPPVEGPVGKHLGSEELHHGRTMSLSPSRSTRFSERISSDLASGKKHDPLPRSTSPAKSALKHSGSGQLTSPMDRTYRHVRGSSITPSDASDSNMSADERVKRKKKSARVSFEPEPEVVGISELPPPSTPVVASPQNRDQDKPSWTGTSKHKSTYSNSSLEDNTIEGMLPRPQLPSFGSIRDKTRRPIADEPKEKEPMKSKKSAQSLSSSIHRAVTSSLPSSRASSASGGRLTDESVSSDHAIGGVLAQESQHDNERDTHKSSSVPLPPDVTSVEGTGYVSDASSESSEDDRRTTKIHKEPRSTISRSEPPQVTEQGLVQANPVESRSLSNGETQSTTAQMLEPPRVDSHQSEEPAVQQIQTATEVPALSLQPPTPHIEQSNPAEHWQDNTATELPSNSAEPPVVLQPAVQDVANKPQPKIQNEKADTNRNSSKVMQEKKPRYVNLDDSDTDDDNASLYSDAAEEITEPDGDGFGSINAIVESPLRKGKDITALPESPMETSKQQRPDGSNRTTSWEAAQARWSGIAQQTRQGQESPTKPSRSTALQPPAPIREANRAPARDTQVAPKPKQTKKTGALAAAALAPRISQRTSPESPPRTSNQSSTYPTVGSNKNTPVQASGNFRQSMRDMPNVKNEPQKRLSMRNQPATQPEPPMRQSMRTHPPVQQENNMKQSMRNQPPPQRETSMRQSMRSAPVPLPNTQSEPGFRKSMRAEPPARVSSNAATQQSRPSGQSRAALQKKNIPAAVPGPTSTSAIKAARSTFANDSDSESSFKKRRRSKTSSPGGQYTMRRSMRASPEPESPPPPAPRGGIRSVSPVARRHFSPVDGQRGFRTTMRNSVDTSPPAIQPPPERRRSSSLFGSLRRAKTPPPPVPTKHPSRSAADERQSKRGFRSRYADSSDDEPEIVDFRPVRGIPRLNDEGDSTELEDSSDEERVSRLRKAPPKNHKSVVRGSGPGDPTSQPEVKKKGGIFSLFRSKDKDKDREKNGKNKRGSDANWDVASQGLAAPAAPAPAPGKTQPASNVLSSKNLGFNSAAERDALVAQTMARLEAARSQSRERGVTETQPTPTRMPNRRAHPERIMSDSWPLVPKVPDHITPRRASLDMFAGQPNGTPLRSGLNQKTPPVGPVAVAGPKTQVPDQTGKKKRFQGLRKVFGLRD